MYLTDLRLYLRFMLTPQWVAFLKSIRKRSGQVLFFPVQNKRCSGDMKVQARIKPREERAEFSSLCHLLVRRPWILLALWGQVA